MWFLLQRHVRARLKRYFHRCRIVLSNLVERRTNVLLVMELGNDCNKLLVLVDKLIRILIEGVSSGAIEEVVGSD